MDMNEFYGRFVPREEQKRIQALEPFDEFEVGLSGVGRMWRGRRGGLQLATGTGDSFCVEMQWDGSRRVFSSGGIKI